MSYSEPLRVVVIVSTDAYLKGASNICKLIAEQTHVDVMWFTTSPHLVTEQLSYLDMAHLCDGRHRQHYPWLFSTQQILAGLGGKDLNRLIHAVHSVQNKTSKRPLIIGYFPGILHFRIFESLATRLCCDFVLLNCVRDYELYHSLVLATVGRNNGLLLGAPWLEPPPAFYQPTDIDLLFVEQSIVPSSQAERTRLVMQLIALARQHPYWRIVVALRARKGKSISHQVENCLEAIWQTLKDGDVNLEFVLDDIDFLLRRSKRVATISSSVAFASIAWGKQTLFINDLGVQKSWGNDLFVDSGYMGPLLGVSQQAFGFNRWAQEFVQLPSAGVISGLYQTTTTAASNYAGAEQPVFSNRCGVSSPSGIPRIHALNLRLLWLVVRFCIRYLKSPLKEFHALFRCTRNINRRIYNIGIPPKSVEHSKQ